MKCKEAQDLIVLFRELSHADRSRLENHILNCSSCAEALQQEQTNRDIAISVFAVRRLDHPRIFTNRVMGALAESPAVNPPLRPVYIPFAAFRMAMAAITLILLAFFIYEVRLDSEQSIHATLPSTESAAVLNTQAFLQRLVDKPNDKDSFFTCVRVCRKDADATPCEMCQKKIKNISL